MFSVLRTPRRAALRVLALLSVLTLAACDPALLGAGLGQNTGPTINANEPVPVALLVPAGSSSGDRILARSLENAARLAISDLDGVQIKLSVYSTGGNASGARTAALQAVNDGAKIILGPVFSENANAASVAVVDQGINVLSFSNNTAIAGGNLFVLGPTFDNTAERLVRYARSQGKGNIFIVSAQSAAEEIGRDAIARAISKNGARQAGSASFELSQQGIVAAVPQIAAQMRATGADTVFFTSTNDGALPFLAQLLPEQGVSAATVQFVGLGRLDIPSEALSQPGLQGSVFALPDQNLYNSFRARYTSAYGGAPHPIAGLAYDGIAAIGALVKSKKGQALTKSALTTNSGFVGVSGIFRLRPDGTNQRALDVAQVRGGQVVVIDRAPRSFGRAGF